MAIVRFIKGGRKNMLLNFFTAKFKTKLVSQSIEDQLLSGLVCKYFGQAFNKMLFLPPFFKLEKNSLYPCLSMVLQNTGTFHVGGGRGESEMDIPGI